MRSKNGITLVELLVVIGIIMLLAGLLYPILNSIRERGRRSHCINNLKQVGAALLMYAQDYDSFAPPFTNLADPQGNFRDRFFPNHNNPVLFEAAYIPYTKDKNIWYCPLDPYAGLSTPEVPLGSEPDTWRAHMWNERDHKATSYAIEEVCAMRVLAPVRIDNPPNYLRKHIAYNSPMPRQIPEDWLGEPLPYAADFTHSKWESIELFFDGSVKVRRVR